MLAPASTPAPTPKARRPRRLLEEVPGEPMEAEVEAGIESSGMEVGILVAAAGGSLWTLCLWYVLRKRASAHCRSGLGGSEAMSLYINVNGDMEEGTDAPEQAAKIFVHLTKESPGEKNSARVPL